MAVTLKDKMKDLSAERRKKVEARGAQLIAEFPDRDPVVLSGIAADDQTDLRKGQGSTRPRDVFFL